jgi:hypothetical protein
MFELALNLRCERACFAIFHGCIYQGLAIERDSVCVC